MTAAEFADLLSRLVGEAEDSGPNRETQLAVIEDMAQAMREAED
jgi:hypothetical protein